MRPAICHQCGVKSVDHPTDDSTRDPVEIPCWLKKCIMERIQNIDPKHTPAYITGALDAYWDVLDMKYDDHHDH